jgi:hypothetical protein
MATQVIVFKQTDIITVFLQTIFTRQNFCFKSNHRKLCSHVPIFARFGKYCKGAVLASKGVILAYWGVV